MLTESQAVTRAYERLGFGAPPGQRASMGFDDAVERLLSPSTRDHGATAALPALEPSPAYPPSPSEAQLRRLTDVERTNRQTITRWWLTRMVSAADQTRERMTWFWHGHFATGASKVQPVARLLQQNELFRRHALESFSLLARAVLTDPAMMQWLDAPANAVAAPNENLAREFMELFTLGTGNYTEHDVREGARALTGWQIVNERATFVPRRFDRSPKTVFGVTAPHTADSFAALCSHRPECAAFVVGRVWFRLMGNTPPPSTTRARLLSAYAGGDVRALLLALARDASFRTEGYTVVKQPVEWFIGLVRCAEVDLREWNPDNLDETANQLDIMGQRPLMPPHVGGWPSGRVWLAAGATRARVRLAQQVGMSIKPQLDAVASAHRAAHLAQVLGVTWTDRTRTALHGLSALDAFTVAACSPEMVISR